MGGGILRGWRRFVDFLHMLQEVKFSAGHANWALVFVEGGGGELLRVLLVQSTDITVYIHTDYRYNMYVHVRIGIVSAYATGPT